MAKLKGPLLSLGAIGRFTKHFSLTRRRKQNIIEKRPIPTDAKSPAQLIWRHMYQKAIALWHGLSDEEQKEWESLARPKHMTGYAWFISQALKPNPGLYLPLQGGTMSGNIVMAGNRILLLPEPIDDQEPARKMDIGPVIDVLNDLLDVNVPDPTDQHFLHWNETEEEWRARALILADIPTAVKTFALVWVIDNGNTVIPAGQWGHLEIPFACTINRATLLAKQVGSIVVDIWKDSYANFPPADGDSITASAPPTITGAQKSQDSVLPGWTTAIAAGDILAFNVDSCATITRLTLSLKVTKS